MRRLALLLGGALAGCATAPVVAAAVAPAAAPAPPPPPRCPDTAPAAVEGDVTTPGATVALVCLLGVGEDERLRVLEAVAPREGQALDADAVAADLETLAGTGFLREARAIAQPLPDGRVVLTWVVTPYPLVGKVAIEGVEHVEVDLLRDLSLKAAWASPWALRRVADAMAELYRRRGFASVAVTPRPSPVVEGKADVTFEVDEGPLTVVASIRFAGNKRVKDAELKKALRSVVRAPWQEANAVIDEAQLSALYYDRGMVNVSVTTSTAPGRGPGEVDVLFTIAEGDVYTLGALTLSGHSLGDEQEVLGSLEAKPGRVFSRVVLQRDLERLRARGARQGVRVEVLPLTKVDADARRIDVTLEVEKQAGGPLKF